MTFHIAAAVVCILLSAFFSGAEMALSSANRIRLENLADDGKAGAALAVKVLDRFDDALSAILIGNNFVNIALSSLGSVIAIVAFGERYAWLSTVIVTIAVIIFGETVPKIIAKKNANRMSLAVAPAVRALSVLLKPLTLLVVSLVHLITGPMRGEEPDDENDAAVEELQSIIETAEDEDVLDEDRSELLQAALDFDEISVSEVMTARVDIVAVDIKDSWEEIYAVACASNYSRIPVYEGSIDNVVGILFLNRFFRAMVGKRRPSLRSMLMPPCYVYKTTKLPDGLQQLRKAKQHLAVVTDEYGGVCGIVTMEDVLEQIVGEIWDETDDVEEEVIERADGVWELDGDMSIGDFTELLGIRPADLESESSTVGGWTLERFGSFPAAGDHFDWEELSVTVLKMDGLRVERILVEHRAPDEDPAE
jgi:CBS domain containing-hemolysin-like protein